MKKIKKVFVYQMITNDMEQVDFDITEAIKNNWQPYGQLQMMPVQIPKPIGPPESAIMYTLMMVEYE
jgi:hypothetical protein